MGIKYSKIISSHEIKMWMTLVLRVVNPKIKNSSPGRALHGMSVDLTDMCLAMAHDPGTGSLALP